MAWGMEAWDDTGREFVTTYSAYNYVMEVPVKAGTHSFTVPDVSGAIECGYVAGKSAGGDTGYVVKSISVSGNTVTYTSESLGQLGAFLVRPVLRVFVRR